MEDFQPFILIAGVLTAALVAFFTTPFARWVAEKVGAIDIPKDERRMHNKPIPRLGGLAIFLGFIVAVLIFADIDKRMVGTLLGALVIVALGIIDDIMALKAWIKLIVQIAAAMIPVLFGVTINVVSVPLFGEGYAEISALSIPITVLWIVAVTNAVNLIDGLDGLAVGVSAISSVTMAVIAMLVSEGNIALIMAALVGACFGFMPYNVYPAKIFMGDTGSTFLGFILACMSVQGLFKMYALVSYIIPFLIIGLPIFDTGFAFFRRLLTGKNPMTPDRGHVHHRLIDLGFNQKQSVAILYAVTGVLGLLAVILATNGIMKIILGIFAVLITAVVGIKLYGQKHIHDAAEHERADHETANHENGEE